MLNMNKRSKKQIGFQNKDWNNESLNIIECTNNYLRAESFCYAGILKGSLIQRKLYIHYLMNNGVLRYRAIID